MTIGLHFPPDGARARRINARMHAELAASLRHVCEQSRGVLDFDAPALTRLIARLERGLNFPAPVFAGYYDLVEAIVEDDPDGAERLFAELAQASPAADGLAVHALGQPELGAETDRYIRMMNADPTAQCGFALPPPEAAADFRARLAEGLELLRKSVPELSEEFRAIVREVVISGSDPAMPAQMDGGSHYRLWGALFLNCEFHPDPVSVVEVLAHESAHSLLFGFCTDMPLVENGEDERYASPLRADPRPLEGIYHATFVSARMHWAMSRVADSGLLSAADIENARAAAAADKRNFESGYGVLAEHSDMTPVGAALMADAKAYMDAQA